jgi:RHS repeat-associated protein
MPTAYGQGISWRVEYNDQGQIARSIDPAGRATQYTYTPSSDGSLHAVTEAPPEGAPVTWQFDADGKVETMKDGEGEVAYHYDNRGQLNAVDRKGSAPIKYSYDDAGRLVELNIGNFYRIAWTYDFLGRIANIQTPAGIISYNYQTGQNTVVRSLPNGVRTTWKRQLNGELDEITHGFSKQLNAKQYAVLAQYQYSHGPDGRIAAINEYSGGQGKFTRQYAYDTMGRLVRATGSGGREYGYEYDQAGNRIKATTSGSTAQLCTYDWAGRLTNVDGKPVQYDACGNMTSATLDGVARKYAYRPDGRLAKAESGNESAEYRYDGNGQLVVRKSTSGETRFIPDPLSGIGHPLVIDEGGVRTLVIWEGDTPLALVRNGKVEWLLHDHLGSVRLVTDAQGKVSRTSDYDPFGVPVNGERSTSLTSGFAGLFRDDLVGGYLTMARAYAPKLGSFLQPDPKKRIPTTTTNDMSLFSYCGEDPVNLIDLDGAEPRSINEIVFDWEINHLSDSYKNREFRVRSNYMVYESILEDQIDNFFEDVSPIIGKKIGVKILEQYGQPKNTGNFLIDKFLPKNLVPEWIGLTGDSKDKAQIFFDYNYNFIRQGEYDRYMAARKNPVGDYLNRTINNQPINGLNRLHTATKFINTTIYRLNLVEEGFINVVKLRARAFQASDPPLYLDKQTSYGWEGNGSYLTPRGLMTFSERQDANVFSNKPISRIHNEKIIDKENDFYYERTEKREVGGLGWWDKLLEYAFPRENLYGPNFKREINTKLSYREERVGGGVINLNENVEKVTRVGEPKQQSTDNKLKKPDDNYPPPFPPDRRNGSPIIIDDEQGPPGGGVTVVRFPRGRDGNALSPSPVGGVYLGGSGRMLEGIGELKGVRTDANGNLVLVGEEGGNIKLPPLRLDDVVTVFRSVYLNGEGPTVTIDPNPRNPQASPMVIRHSKATEDTYVGWVLYEADRLMKGYGQGVDNITQKDIASRVTGYANVLETTYFGGGNPQEAQKIGIWERFWIVPAESRRYEGSRKELTLFDVPLKVKTQKMRWQNGKLVDDLTGNSSPGAQAFTSWFTTNYDAIGGEQYLTPPKESGMSKPVPVFTELRRIALLTAVAEKLRDQGVPMPFWMHDYDVRKVPFEHVTPAMEVTRRRSSGSTIHTARVFGGVELSPESRSVKTYSTAGDVAKAPADIRNEVDRSVKLAERLERVITDTSPVPLTVNRVSDGSKEYKVVSIPGTETQALGPCRLGDVDLAVPVAGGSELQLSRSFNSFFTPKGVLGQGWTMDLPRLQEVRIPGNREGGKVSYTMGYELLTPLNSVYARFKDIRPVMDLPGSTLQVPDAEGPFYGLATGKPDFFKNAKTHYLLLKNGQEWHFSEYGDLVAIKDGPQVTIYEQDSNSRISRIVSVLGRQLAGEIKLGYDGNGKLIKATGNSFDNKHAKPVEVTYTYDTMGRLAGVIPFLKQKCYNIP